MYKQPPFELAKYVNLAAPEYTTEGMDAFTGIPAVLISKFAGVSRYFKDTVSGLEAVDVKDTIPQFKKLIKARQKLHARLDKIDFAKVKNRRTPYQPTLVRDIYKVAMTLDDCYTIVESEFNKNLDDASDYLGTIISDPLTRNSPRPIAIPKTVNRSIDTVNKLLDDILNRSIVADHAKVKEYAPTVQHISNAIELAIKFKAVSPDKMKALYDRGMRISDYTDSVIEVLNKENITDTKILKLRLHEAAVRTDLAARSLSLSVSVYKLISDLFVTLTYAVEAVTD